MQFHETFGREHRYCDYSFTGTSGAVAGDGYVTQVKTTHEYSDIKNRNAHFTNTVLTDIGFNIFSSRFLACEFILLAREEIGTNSSRILLLCSTSDVEQSLFPVLNNQRLPANTGLHLAYQAQNDLSNVF